MSIFAVVTRGQLPDGCVPLNDQPLSSVDPSIDWGSTDVLWDHTPPKRIGAWGDTQAKKTGHFATNQATNNMVGIQQFPYVGKTISLTFVSVMDKQFMSTL